MISPHPFNRIFGLTLFIASLGLAPRAFAQSLESSASLKNTAARATVSLLEFNPADLMWGRYRFAHESLVIESLSVSIVGEVQDTVKQGRFEEKNIAMGLGVQYYPQAISLDGLFLRGESALALSKVVEDATARRAAQSANVASVQLAGDLGWRVRLTDRLTGSAAYGLETTISQALWSNDAQTSERWINEKASEVVPRVQINLGVLL